MHFKIFLKLLLRKKTFHSFTLNIHGKKKKVFENIFSNQLNSLKFKKISYKISSFNKSK